MATRNTTNLSIAEMREFANFSPCEQRFIRRNLDIGLGRCDAFKLWARNASENVDIRRQYVAYQDLKAVRHSIPDADAVDSISPFIGQLARLAAFDLAQDGTPVGVEFGVSSVTSPGFEGYLPQIPTPFLERALVDSNPQLQWADTSRRGYMAVELTPQAASCEWRFVSGVRQRSTALGGTHRMASALGSNTLAIE